LYISSSVIVIKRVPRIRLYGENKHRRGTSNGGPSDLPPVHSNKSMLRRVSLCVCVCLCGKYLRKNNNNICRVRRVGDRSCRSINANRPTFRRGVSDGRRLHMQVGEDLRSVHRTVLRWSWLTRPLPADDKTTIKSSRK